ncbi:uL22 family ribosomal protein [Candidatus Vidania fulgoroideorum]
MLTSKVKLKSNISLKKILTFIKFMKSLKFITAYRICCNRKTKIYSIILNVFNLALNKFKKKNIKHIYIDYFYANKCKVFKKIIYLSKGRSSIIKKKICFLNLNLIYGKKSKP